jgi:hypothetical protein
MNLPNGVKEAVGRTAFATIPAIASTGAMLLIGHKSARGVSALAAELDPD